MVVNTPRKQMVNLWFLVMGQMHFIMPITTNGHKYNC